MKVAYVVAAVALASPVVALALPAPAPMPTPPGVPSTSTAQTELAALMVAPQGSQDGYSRSLFPHWITING